MLIALVVIVWGSAIVSAFIDNIPFVTTMVSCEKGGIDVILFLHHNRFL